MSYVLITPARNEEAHIETVIRSVTSQTVLPKKWVIVSDGSTDRTDEIVQAYVRKHDWIDYLRMPEHRDRHFAAKVSCFNAGYERVKRLQYDIMGNLDADISFDPGYFEFLLSKFEDIPHLGVAGTPFIEEGYSSLSDSYEGGEHVAGGCQLFRRECFKEIGGYSSVKPGSVDKIAVVTARMKGWKTQSFRETFFFHHRKLGTGGGGKWRAIFEYGRRDYRMGRHPLWEFLRILYQATKRPYLLNGLLLMGGYLWAFVTREERPVSKEFVAFVQREQMRRLRTILGKALGQRTVDKYAD